MEINPVKYLTPRRLWNIARITASFQLSRLLRKPVVYGMPVSYSIEPTNRCNFSCPECPSGTGELTRPLGMIDAAAFRAVVDQVSKDGFYLQLYFQGEPYINKQLPEMIRYAQSKNMYVSVSTNGSLFTESTVERLMSAPPDKLIFSIDGLDNDTYQKYRIGGTFQQADKGLRMVTSMKKKLGSRKPYIELQFIVMKHNEHQVNDVLDYGSEAGCDKTTLKTMQVYSIESADEFLPSLEQYRRYIVENGSFRIKGKMQNHCFALWRTSVITWDGRVVPCCFDKDAAYEVGRLNGRSFRDVWHSDELNAFRQKVLQNRPGVPMCTNCTEGLNMNIMEIEN